MAEIETARAMTLEEFASISAALEAGLPRDEILLEAGFSEAAWNAAEERWLRTLAEQAAQGRLRPSRRYVEIFGVRQSAAMAQARKLRRRLPGKAPVPPEPPIAPRLTTAVEKVAPTALREADAPARIPHGALVPAPVVERPPSLLAREERDDREGTALIDIAQIAPKVRALPFAETDGDDDEAATLRAPHVDGALPFTAPEATDAPATETLPLRWSTPPPADALPFTAPEATDASATETLPLRRSSQPSASALPFVAPEATDASVFETLPPRWSPPAQQGGLPFLRPAAPPPVAAPPVAAPPVAAPPSVAPPVAAPPPARLAAGMFEMARVTPYDRWSLADYANLCAGVRAFPTHVPWLQSQLGMTPESWTALHALWQQRFQHDPDLKERWQWLIAERVPHWKGG